MQAAVGASSDWLANERLNLCLGLLVDPEDPDSPLDMARCPTIDHLMWNGYPVLDDAVLEEEAQVQEDQCSQPQCSNCQCWQKYGAQLYQLGTSSSSPSRLAFSARPSAAGQRSMSCSHRAQMPTHATPTRIRRSTLRYTCRTVAPRWPLSMSCSSIAPTRMLGGTAQACSTTL